ncbi:hypothetical protein Pan258_24580 [Symmachiella dynata]|nr:hypothetical protein Pan258_24580 [Symmachiella dynata]
MSSIGNGLYRFRFFRGDRRMNVTTPTIGMAVATLSLPLIITYCEIYVDDSVRRDFAINNYCSASPKYDLPSANVRHERALQMICNLSANGGAALRVRFGRTSPKTVGHK